MSPDSFWSLLKICAGFVLGASMGFGAAYALLPSAHRRHALVAAPTIGTALFCLFTIVVSANFRMPAAASVWIAAPLLLAASLGAVFIAGRRGEMRELWAGSRPALWPLALMVVACFWPVIFQNTALYLGTANPDFYQSLAYHEALTRFGLGALDPRPAIDYSLDPFFGSFPDPIPAKFGGVMFSLLLAKTLHLGARDALMTALVVFLLGLPLATYLFTKVVLQATDRVATAAALLMAVSGPVTMSFMHVLVGQNSSLALLPLDITICFLALATRDWRPLLLAFLLIDATFWMYVMLLPYIGVPVGLYAAYDAARNRRGAATWVLGALALFTAGIVLLQWGMGTEVRQLVEEISALLGRPNRSVYVDFLTEMSVPYSVGLSSYPMGSNMLVSSYPGANYVAWAAGYVGLSFLVIGLYFRAVAAWARGADAANRAFVLITLAVYGAVWLYFTFVSLYGYAIFKMASWLQFFFVPFIAFALWTFLPQLGRRGARGAEALWVAGVATVFIAGNVVSSLDFSVKSLGHDTRKGAIVNSYGIGGNPDYPALAQVLPRLVPRGEIVAIAMPDFIANLWAAHYVVKAGMRAGFVTHDDFPDEDVSLPDVKTGVVRNTAGTVAVYRPRYFAGDRAAYYLLEGPGNLNQEITENRTPAATVWSDKTFSLVAAHDAKDILVTGRGFYRLEYFDRRRLSWWWPDRMRWTPEGGEFILLHASRPEQPHRLSFVAVAGAQRDKPRHLELWHNGRLFDEVVVHGAARVVSKPFLPTGSRDKLVVRLREHVGLTPRNFGLWNRQIPTEQRYLNMVFAQAKTLTPDEPVSAALPGKLTAKDLIDASRRFDGISLDGWALPGAHFELPLAQEKSGRLVLSIVIPGWAGFRFPFVVRFVANGQAIERQFDKPGDYDVPIDVRRDATTLLLTMEPEQSAQVAGVGRASFVIKSLAVE